MIISTAKQQKIQNIRAHCALHSFIFFSLKIVVDNYKWLLLITVFVKNSLEENHLETEFLACINYYTHITIHD